MPVTSSASPTHRTPRMRVLSSALRRLLPAVLAAAAALLAGTAGAQTTTGGIRGRVTDPAGTPLPAATVVAVNEQTGFSNGAQSDEQGIFTIRLLPPGTYRVTARRLGSQQVEVAGVRVALATNATQNFTLTPVAVTLQGVQVTADRPVDATETGVAQTVSTEQIENLPALGRDFTDFINLSGFVSPTPEATTGGQFSIAGQRPSQTSIQIDGVDANNAFFGENRGGSRIPFNFSLESIREFQIVTNGYDVEYGNYSGGVVNIVTQSGGNDFDATVYGNYRGDRLTGENFDGSRPRNFEVQQYSAQVSGPVVKDKLFYLFSLDGQRRREPFRPINSANASTPEFAAGLERFYDILETQYGIENAGASYDEFETSNDVLTLFGRVDWTISQANRFSLRHNYSDHDNLNETGSARGGVSQAESFKNTSNSLVGELTSSFGETRSNVLRFQWSGENRPRVGNELRPEILVRSVVPGQSIEYGGSFISFNNRLVEDKVQLIDNFTWQVGSHALKVGTNNVLTWVRNDFWLNGSGGFVFSDLDALEAGTPTSYTRNIRADGSPPSAEFQVQEYSLYAQDEWQATPRIFVSAGVRYDVARYADAPLRVVEAERAFGIETGLSPVDKNNISPRLSVTYDVNGDATQLVRAGVGLFYGRVPYVLGGNVAQTEIPLLALECTGSAAEGDPDAPPPVLGAGGYAGYDPSGADNPFNCAGAAGIGGVPEYSFWNPEFELPETIKANLGYERLLGPGTKLSFDFIYTASNKLYTVRNVNLREAQFVLAGEGSRRVFVPEGSFTPSDAGTSARHLNTDFADIYVNYNDGAARSQAASIGIDHRFSDDVSVQGSYTYTAANDNSSFSCCTSNAGFGDRKVGALGPNVTGGIGDEGSGWGPSDFVRNHTVVVSGFTKLPWGVTMSAIWRLQSGTPWGPEQSGDLNGDGEEFNDLPYIFPVDELPIAIPGGVSDAEALEFVAQQRARYARYLADNECIGDHVGRIIPRSTCRQPWFNRLDISLRKRFETLSAQSAELSLDLFNVLNGLNSDWGQYESVSAQRRNLLSPERYDATTNQILYTVPQGFGDKTSLGTNLLLQFSAQVGLRYYF